MGCHGARTSMLLLSLLLSCCWPKIMSDVDQNLVLMRHSLCVCGGGGREEGGDLQTHWKSTDQSVFQVFQEHLSVFVFTSGFLFILSGLQTWRRPRSVSLCKDRQRTPGPWVEGITHTHPTVLISTTCRKKKVMKVFEINVSKHHSN